MDDPSMRVAAPQNWRASVIVNVASALAAVGMIATVVLAERQSWLWLVPAGALGWLSEAIARLRPRTSVVVKVLILNVWIPIVVAFFARAGSAGGVVSALAEFATTLSALTPWLSFVFAILYFAASIPLARAWDRYENPDRYSVAR